jgi:sulfur-carrier protein adenylyltransferase/sulfurtransferase
MSRYSRQMILPEVGPEGQKKLKRSSVLIVGAGGLGVPAAVSLATAGVGTIGLVDGDSVELPNLHRQFLYSAEDVGRDKVEVAAERLERLNSNVTVEPYSKHLDSSNALGILDDYDVVVDATDNFPSRYLINDACVILGKPDVYASVLRLEGQASVFFPPGGPCYRCLFPEPPPPNTVPSCAEAGVLGAVTGVMGGIQAIQAVNLILGGGPTLVGRLLVFDAHETSFEELKIRRSEECAVCGIRAGKVRLIDYERFCGIEPRPRSGIKEVEPTDLKMSLDSGEGPLLLDVREPYEYGFCHLEGSKLVPLGELPGRLKEFDRERDIVVYCHTGVRSAKAAEFLSDSGFRRVRNLRGGIKAWSEEVDPRIPSY